MTHNLFVPSLRTRVFAAAAVVAMTAGCETVGPARRACRL